MNLHGVIGCEFESSSSDSSSSVPPADAGSREDGGVCAEKEGDREDLAGDEEGACGICVREERNGHK